MAEFHTMPFNVSDYLSDTMHLTTLQHGAYLLLIMTLWRAGGYLPDDDARLARICKLTNGQWNKNRDVIMEFLRTENGDVFHPRVIDNLKAVRQKSKSQANNARAKYRKTLDTSSPMAEPKSSQNLPYKDKDKDKELASYINYQGKRGTEIFSVETALGDGHGFSEREISEAIDRWLVGDCILQDVTETIRNIQSRANFAGADHLTYFDEPILEATNVRKAKEPIDPKNFTGKQWKLILTAYKRRKDWHQAYGPAPGQDGCLAPVELLDPITNSVN